MKAVTGKQGMIIKKKPSVKCFIENIPFIVSGAACTALSNFSGSNLFFAVAVTTVFLIAVSFFLGGLHSYWKENISKSIVFITMFFLLVMAYSFYRRVYAVVEIQTIMDNAGLNAGSVILVLALIGLVLGFYFLSLMIELINTLISSGEKYSNVKTFFSSSRIYTGKRQAVDGIIIGIVLIFISAVIMMMSPLNPFCEGMAGTDSSVFKYVALVISKGGMPYKDVFDHKGPLLYIINYAGLLISYYRGLWIVEILFMMAFLLVLYKIARLLCGRLPSIAIVILSCAWLSTYFEGGNFTEEYSMVFIAVSIYIFLDYFINNRVSKLRLVVCGLCFGAVALLRVNMVAVWVVFSVAVLIQSINRKDKKWCSFLAWFLIGTAVIVIPIIIWLVANSAFNDFVDDYIIFNLKYTSASNDNPFMGRCGSFAYFFSNVILLGAVTILLCLIKKKEELFLNITYFVGIIFSLAAISISGMDYHHYGMIVLPLLVYPYAKLYGLNTEGDSSYRKVFNIVLAATAFGAWLIIGREAATASSNYVQGNVSTLSEDEKAVVNIIKENTDEDERIMVLGSQDIWYVLSGRLAASKYSYQSPIASIDDEILSEVIEDIVNNEPRLVIVSGDYTYLFPNIEDYEEIYSCLSDSKAVIVYKK